MDQVEDNVFLAKLAVYSREKAFMKDMPAALLLVLSKRDPGLFRQVFDRVVDNGRVLRTLFQMVRSGQFGRKSLSYSLQQAFQALAEPGEGWDRCCRLPIGNDPSLRDVLRLARPTPSDNSRRAPVRLADRHGRPRSGRRPRADDLPREVRALTAYRQSSGEEEQVAILERQPLPLGLAGRRGPRSEGLEGDCPADGSAGPAHEPEHAAAARCAG